VIGGFAGEPGDDPIGQVEGGGEAGFLFGEIFEFVGCGQVLERGENALREVHGFEHAAAEGEGCQAEDVVPTDVGAWGLVGVLGVGVVFREQGAEQEFAVAAE